MSTNLHGCVQFKDDESGYLQWLEENPTGYVLNSFRTPTPSYLQLHKATCRWINTGRANNWTTGNYIKTCSMNAAALDLWAREATGGGVSTRCRCQPELGLDCDDSSSRSESAPEQLLPPPSPIPVRHDLPSRSGLAAIPAKISTGCPELDRAWESYASMILDRPHILIPDTDDDLTWHAFLGHSIDMQGFRAAEFAGVDRLTRNAPNFVPLKARGIGVAELAALWQVPEIRDHLRSQVDDLPLDTTLQILSARGGKHGASLAEAFRQFPWRKFHWSVRALLQNSDKLRSFGFSFRRWLVEECEALGVRDFPPADFQQIVLCEGRRTTLEQALRSGLRRDFYMVGPAMSAYMLCDWQLWLWRQGKTAVFANFKLDSFHEKFVKRFGGGLVPAEEVGFARWWLTLLPGIPPRLANECIWLAVENKQVHVW